MDHTKQYHGPLVGKHWHIPMGDSHCLLTIKKPLNTQKLKT